MRVFRSLILAATIASSGLVMASSAAHAAVRVYVNAGPSGPGYYGEGSYASSYPGYSWIPAYYDEYGNYYPGRWVAMQGWRQRQSRENQWREHQWRERREREQQDNWYRQNDRQDYRDENHDRDDRHRDWDDRHHERDEDD